MFFQTVCMECGLEVCPVPGKGLGMVTIRPWQQGELLAREQPCLMLKEGHSQDAQQRFSKTFANFEPEKKFMIMEQNCKTTVVTMM